MSTDRALLCGRYTRYRFSDATTFLPVATRYGFASLPFDVEWRTQSICRQWQCEDMAVDSVKTSGAYGVMEGGLLDGTRFDTSNGWCQMILLHEFMFVCWSCLYFICFSLPAPPLPPSSLPPSCPPSSLPPIRYSLYSSQFHFICSINRFTQIPICANTTPHYWPVVAHCLIIM